MTTWSPLSVASSLNRMSNIVDMLTLIVESFLWQEKDGGAEKIDKTDLNLAD